MLTIALATISCLQSKVTIDDYDLSSLKQDKPFEVEITDNNLRFRVRDVIKDYEGTPCDCETCVAQLITLQTNYCQCIGDNETEEFKPLADESQGFSLIYNYTENAPKVFQLNMLCGSKSEPKGKENGNTVTLTWTHPAGCLPKKPSVHPEKKKLSFGSIMLIIIASLLFLYFAAGIPLMFFAFKKRGIDIIPFGKVWMKLFALVKDGCLCLVSPLCKRKQGYAEVKDTSAV